MSSSGYSPDEYEMTRGVIMRRCLAWCVDAVLISLLVFGLWWAMAAIGLLTLGLGFGLMALLPFVPLIYHLVCLMGPDSATPGQRLFDLIVRRDLDLGPPTPLQAVIAIAVYYLTLATSGLLLVVALFTTRQRTLHDLLSGLVVVRLHAFRAFSDNARFSQLTPPFGYGNMPPPPTSGYPRSGP